MIILRKYPVIWEGQEYEVRWEASDLYRYNSELEIDEDDIKIVLYKVTQHKGLLKLWFGKHKYEEVYYLFKTIADSTYKIMYKEELAENPDMYIEEAKILVGKYKREYQKKLHKDTLDKEKVTKLNNWNGIINI